MVAMALLGLSSSQVMAKAKTEAESIQSGHNPCLHSSSAKSCQVEPKTRTVKARLGYSKIDARPACGRVQKYAKAAGGFEKGWQLEIHPGNQSDGKPLAKCDLDAPKDSS